MVGFLFLIMPGCSPNLGEILCCVQMFFCIYVVSTTIQAASLQLQGFELAGVTWITVGNSFPGTGKWTQLTWMQSSLWVQKTGFCDWPVTRGHSLNGASKQCFICHLSASVVLSRQAASLHTIHYTYRGKRMSNILWSERKLTNYSTKKENRTCTQLHWSGLFPWHMLGFF